MKENEHFFNEIWGLCLPPTYTLLYIVMIIIRHNNIYKAIEINLILNCLSEETQGDSGFHKWGGQYAEMDCVFYHNQKMKWETHQAWSFNVSF